jgi:hypothetical protein
MSTTVGDQPLQSAAEKALARADDPTGPPPKPGWDRGQLVAQLYKTGLADFHIAGRAEAESFAPDSLDYAVTVASLGNSALTLALGLEVPLAVVMDALNEIWDEVCRSRNPKALVQAAREGTVRRLGALGATPEELEMFRQLI